MLKLKIGQNYLLIDHTRRNPSNYVAIAYMMGCFRGHNKVACYLTNQTNIRDLAKVLNVSYDSLLDDSLDLNDPRVLNTVLNNEKQMTSKSHLFHYEYKSERMIGNLPLIHINIGTGLYVAKGIIAIGNFSFGLVSLGIISLGLLSLGAFSLGLISFGAISIGILLALGSISAGFISLGACAFGYLSIGACAIGNYSLGAYAYGATLSYGAKAEGGLAFSTENGAITFTKEYIKMIT